MLDYLPGHLLHPACPRPRLPPTAPGDFSEQGPVGTHKCPDHGESWFDRLDNPSSLFLLTSQLPSRISALLLPGAVCPQVVAKGTAATESPAKRPSEGPSSFVPESADNLPQLRSPWTGTKPAPPQHRQLASRRGASLEASTTPPAVSLLRRGVRRDGPSQWTDWGPTGTLAPASSPVWALFPSWPVEGSLRTAHPQPGAP